MRSTFKNFLGTGGAQRFALLGILVLILLLCLIAIPEFRSWRLIASMINSQSIILLLALVATIVLRTGGFDLSISQTMVGSAALTIVLIKADVPLAVAIPLAIVLGAAVGALNGLLVVGIGVDSFVTTLGSYSALAGFAYLVTNSSIVAGVPPELVNAVRSEVLGIPLVTWYAWILALVLWFVYQRTPLGRYMLFVGGNPDAARLAGVRVKAVRFGAYLASGVLSALVGLIFLGYFGAVDPGVGGQYMLQPLAAAFLGTTAIVIGRFNAIGTVVALYLLIVGITGLQVLGAQTWVTNVFYGVALMVAVAASKLAGRKRALR
ncbi:ABC transporter permease [Herbiconiux sp.]|jgi:ribose transport system permease protein|uniref:ABC transporter permease n=1 Tax=Herbiconiux sp. TaxID=1871186 RepID=UPI0025BB5782|nr:ABC transporter permease [Herbiconiux sp.]